MNVRSRSRTAAALAGAAALCLGLLSTPASADYATPPWRPLAGVGSDTTQYVMNGLGEVVVDADGNKLIGSWDAVTPVGGADPVVTKDPATTPGCSFSRASVNGSRNGIDRLSDDIYLGGNTCIDFARSSRGPRGAAGSDLLYIPFARDALTYATDFGSLLPTSLTRGQLRSIYLYCMYTDSAGITQFVRPLIPHSGSGIYQRWLDYLGIPAPGDCVDRTIQPNDGRAITAGDQMMPYSVAQWISQGKAIPDLPNRRGESRLRYTDGSAPTTGSGTALAINPDFVLTHDVYNVVQTTRWTEPAVSDAFVGSGSDVCQAISTIQLYGFLPIGNCGSTALGGRLWS